MVRRRMLTSVVVIVMLMTLAAGVAGCADTSGPITEEQVSDAFASSTRAEVEDVFGSSGSSSPVDQDTFEFFNRDDLDYRFWGDEDRWVGIGFDGDEVMDTFATSE